MTRLQCRLRQLALAAALAMGALTGLSACGSGGAEDTGPGVSAEVKALSDYMTNWYLWYAQLPIVNLTTLATPEATLAALRAPQDRYSFIELASTFNAFYDASQALGFGLGYGVAGNAVFVRFVQPLSNAAAGGLLRGDQITAIDGTPVATLIAENRLDAAFGPAQVGVTITLTIARGAATLSIVMTKDWYTVRTVLDSRVIDDGGRKVGYLHFYAFTDPARAEWSTALATLLDAGAQDLVVDLRYNGGGLINTGAAIGSTLVPAGLSGQVYTRLEFNDKHSASNQSYLFAADSLAGRVERLAWITTDRTCSASEGLMIGLRPWRTAVSIGTTTCGKPVGFSPPQFNDKVYNIVTFRQLNAAGFTDFFTGLTADCPGEDDLGRPLGDPAENMLAGALVRLRTGACAPVTAGTTALKSSGQAGASTAGTTLLQFEGQGMERQTGLK